MVTPQSLSPGTTGLGTFISACPSPFHVAALVRDLLIGLGATEVSASEPWPSRPGLYVLVDGGAVVAWSTLGDRDPLTGFRIIGAHTDSPNLRLRPRPDRSRAGFAQLGVEVYGSPLLNSWLDRDLGLSGRVMVRTPRGPEARLLTVDRPLLRVPQLAIHLDRRVNEGLVIDPQEHLVPVWGSEGPDVPTFVRWCAGELGVAPDDVLSFDVMTHDLTAPAVLGADESLFAAARLDNQVSCHAALLALAGATEGHGPVPVIALFDHEEVGSASATGAGGPLLPSTLERIVATAADDRDAFHRSMARSVCLSADGAHALHPNHMGRHEPGHAPIIGRGPVVKHNANVRYATDAPGAALVRTLAEEVGVELQSFVTRGDLPCGSTIGPTTAAALGATTVDLGVAQLSMHSARELCAAADLEPFSRLLGRFLAAP